MKSTYQLESAQELTPEIIAAIQKAFGNQPITITIEGHKTKRIYNKASKTKTDKKLDTAIAESVVDMILKQLNKRNSKK